MNVLRPILSLRACVLLVTLSTAGLVRAGEPQSSVDTAALDRAVDDAFARYHLPGLAVGMVANGKVAYVRTVGELEAGSGKKIDADTLFKIASNSKAMTTAVLARLVDAGKLQWDDPVQKYLPDFQMHDPWVSTQMQVRDLLVHNSGLGAGAGDLMLWPGPNDFTRRDVIHGLRYLKPVYSFRSRYAYDNTLYIVAGEVAAVAGGAPYETLVRREIFGPLGMDRCQVGEWSKLEVGNVAQPHRRANGVNTVVAADGDIVPNVPMAAAGGIRCSMGDMLEWVAMWLQPQTHGLVDGQPWLSDQQRKAVWSAQTIMPLSDRMREWDDSHYSAYGYGWRLTDVDGTQKVSHTGTLSGMYSAVTLLPEKDVGFVILINGDADEARTVLNQVMVKSVTDPGSAQTIAYYAEKIEAESGAATATQSPATIPAREKVQAAAAGGRLGIYRDPWLGEVAICPSVGGVTFQAKKSPLMHGEVMEAGGRLMVQWQGTSMDTDAWLDFSRTEDGQSNLKMSKVDREADFSSDFEDLDFTRVRDCPVQSSQ